MNGNIYYSGEIGAEGQMGPLMVEEPNEDKSCPMLESFPDSRE